MQFENAHYHCTSIRDGIQTTKKNERKSRGDNMEMNSTIPFHFNIFNITRKRKEFFEVSLRCS
jgi:hypothetical protein